MAVGLSVDLAIRSGAAGYAAVIRCEGELDMVSAAKLIDAFDRIGVQPLDEVQVDLRGVEFMDSTGLGCLAHGALAFQKQGTSFEVLASEPVRNLIDRTGLKALLTSPA